jgi:Methyltransferase domain
MSAHGSWTLNPTFPRTAPRPSSGRILPGDLRRLAVAAALAAVIPRDAHVLDVGGGDGQPLNHLLAICPDLTITTLDLAPLVGQWIDPRYQGQVKRLPRTSLAEFVACPHAHPDVILIADVMHHIPKSARHEFLDSVGILLDRVPSLRVIVKDVEPGHWRALLGFWSDRYVTGDRNVSLISRDDVTRLFAEVLGILQREDTDLFKDDCPNYAIVYRRKPSE